MSIDQIVDDMANNMPMPQPNAIAAAQAEIKIEELEAAKESGGIEQPKKRGRPKGVKNSKPKSVLGEIGGASQGANSASPADAGAYAAAIAVTQCVGTLGIIVGGEDFKFIKDEKTGEDEAGLMTGAWHKYFEAKGVKDIPPGAALAMVLTTYALRRFTMPSSQMKNRWGRIKEFMGGLFRKKQPKTEVIRDAQPDSGNDSKRQNDTRGANVGTIPKAAKWN